MQATDILMEEHKVILRVIGSLETEAGKLAAGQAGAPRLLSGRGGFHQRLRRRLPP